MPSTWGFFVQDDWKIASNLTLNVGLRYEYHPMFRDHYNNLANFDPAYTSVQDGVTVPGTVIIPVQQTRSIVNPGFAESIAPTPILTAAQAGVPASLRYSQKTDFAPRLGFAWRPFHDDKTVIRGGYGKFIQTLLGSAVLNAWAVEASDVATFTNSVGSNGQPAYTLPYAWPSNIAQPGSQSFYLATNIHYKDPYVQEWNVTMERDLGKGVGIRLSYDGNHGSNLGILENINQIPANTAGLQHAGEGSAPFPLFQYIAYQTNAGFSNYNAGTVSVQKRMSQGLQFQASYAFHQKPFGMRRVSLLRRPITLRARAGGRFRIRTIRGWITGTSRSRGGTGFWRLFLYDLPFGQGKTFLNSGSRLVNAAIGGWELSGILLFQSGPFMTVTTNSDPSGTGYNLFNANGGRADAVAGASPYASQSINQWINPNAFVDPGDNIGRFGSAAQGSVTGPHTSAVGLSLLKSVTLVESARLQIGAQVSNAFNHPNYAPPGNLNSSVPEGFGQITSLQTAEGAGPRAIQLTARITF